MTLPHETLPAPGPAAPIRALVPAIRSERLHLRAPELLDFPVLADIATSPRGRGIGGPMSREEAWGEFVQMTATWLLRGHGFWSFSRKDTGETIGFAGIGFEPGDRELELGYMLTEAAEGRGYAAEAAGAVRDHGFGPLGLPTMVSDIFRNNDRSISLVRRLGAVEDTPEDRDDPETAVFRHIRGGASA